MKKTLFILFILIIVAVSAGAYFYLIKNNNSIVQPNTDAGIEKSHIKPCIITGCSGQVCSDEEVVTTCEFLPEYGCYTEAVCERQASGDCGWTTTKEFESCAVEQNKINEYTKE
jgi:uncharacterized alpha/beta hydrolase family protein